VSRRSHAPQTSCKSGTGRQSAATFDSSSALQPAEMLPACNLVEGDRIVLRCRFRGSRRQEQSAGNSRISNLDRYPVPTTTFRPVIVVSISKCLCFIFEEGSVHSTETPRMRNSRPRGFLLRWRRDNADIPCLRNAFRHGPRSHVAPPETPLRDLTGADLGHEPRNSLPGRRDTPFGLLTQLPQSCPPTAALPLQVHYQTPPVSQQSKNRASELGAR
jgi:hypothetical protein